MGWPWACTLRTSSTFAQEEATQNEAGGWMMVGKWDARASGAHTLEAYIIIIHNFLWAVVARGCCSFSVVVHTSSRAL